MQAIVVVGLCFQTLLSFMFVAVPCKITADGSLHPRGYPDSGYGPLMPANIISTFGDLNHILHLLHMPVHFNGVIKFFFSILSGQPSIP
ncbi:hypothetical protein K402DRAFT_8748 [Aulographum hederae CBS 113979]|uniref:Uncharacterized protein n=1 Tax=Aulographum hederae CBS 113979 TaxID=1176131 RepID=A0A6G1HH35_9PEZI|nr:hypothetical protein K402DRAFT_8748 [Aulographum hederae CBS 113979]